MLVLISPVPGATNVAITTNALFFSGTPNGPGGTSSIKMTWPSGGSFQTNVLTPAGDEYSVTIPQLQATTTYTVYDVVSTSESYPCNTLTEELGSFTTQ